MLISVRIAIIGHNFHLEVKIVREVKEILLDSNYYIVYVLLDSMNTTTHQMGNGLYVKVNTMTPWELERLNSNLRNGSNVKYEVTNIEEYEAEN